ncbi:MAG: hypothetical protein H8F28_01820 [Fibrella sp.]|nr:hypothetical protein [Armatimonadota bacterium]
MNFLWPEEYPALTQAIFHATQEFESLEAEYSELIGAVELYSERADAMRQNYKHALDTQRTVRSRPVVAPPAHERVLHCLKLIEAGQQYAWVQLTWELTLAPDSDGYVRMNDADLTSLPGWINSDALVRGHIVDAAEQFLREHSPNDGWLANLIKNNEEPDVVSAAYKACLLLYRERPDALQGLSDQSWKAWASTVVLHPVDGGSVDNEEAHRRLATLAHRSAPVQTVDAIMCLIDAANLSTNRMMPELSPFTGCLDGMLGEKLISKMFEPTLRADGLRYILYALTRSEQPEIARRAVDAATRLLLELLSTRAATDDATDTSGTSAKIISISTVLLKVAPGASWHVIWPAIRDDSVVGQSIIEGYARMEHDSGTPLQDVPEASLADLYLWMVEQFPPETGQGELRQGVMRPIDYVANLRDRLPSVITRRNTDAGVQTLASLVAKLPGQESLNHLLRQAQEGRRRATWCPATPEQVIRLATNSDARLVRSADELLDAVIESLEEWGSWLQNGVPTAVSRLWHKVSAPGKMRKYHPVDENTMSDYAMEYLEQNLKPRLGASLAREVVIRTGHGGVAGERTDIHIVATTQTRSLSGAYDTVTVVIESKGNWNPDLDTAMADQLVKRYLRGPYRHGIYLVGWFDSPMWDQGDQTRKERAARQAAGSSLADARDYFERQAITVSLANSVNVRAFVVDTALR